MMSNPRQTKRKLRNCIVLVCALLLMLAITTFALISSLVSVEDSIFDTARVEIELNDGNVIFDQSSGALIEPGMAMKEDFTIENKSSVDVYYRLYLENVKGALQEALVFEIYDGDTKLYSGPASDFTKENPCLSQVALQPGETKVLSAVVKMNESGSNLYQNGTFTFDLTADAVQKKNNPNQLFD